MSLFTRIFKNPWGVFKYNRGMANFNAQKLVSSANMPLPELYQQLKTSERGLSEIEVEARLVKFGKNEVAREERLTWWRRLFNTIRDPLVILLTFLALISFLTGDLRATIVIGVMIVLGVILRYFQESRADNAAAKLKAMVSTSCTVFRDDKQSEIPLEQ